MTKNPAHTIPDLIMANIPRDLLMGIEDALEAGAMRAFSKTKDLAKGHRKSGLGQMRHFQMNETFNEALLAANAEMVPLRGNGVVVGKSGVLQLSRLNISESAWNNSNRSVTRRKLAEANKGMKHLLLPSLFDPVEVNAGTLFIVACFSGSLQIHPEKPTQIYIAVPDEKMEGWLFREKLGLFLSRYDEAPKQVDLAQPKLKTKLLNTERQTAS
ncbi:hypothetical protein [Pseudomonas monteilii]|uniref:hypothetical protein n=1 Tax=Pseudomonas monteilii TaxID=76759 RepID=UPI00048BD209|nr:hypothetical protein [Pseudomonas monteilii]